MTIFDWLPFTYRQIEEWLRRSRDSYFFCLESFTAVSGMEEASVMPFLSGKAIENRQVTNRKPLSTFLSLFLNNNLTQIIDMYIYTRNPFS